MPIRYTVPLKALGRHIKMLSQIAYALKNRPKQFGEAVRLAILGHHHITLTKKQNM